MTSDQITTLDRIGNSLMEVVHEQWLTQLELKTSKSVTRLHGGMLTMLRYELVITQIANLTDPVR